MIRYQFKKGQNQVLVAAIHEGHMIRPGLLPYFSLTDSERLREEDPYTGFLTSISDLSLVVDTSRFETDLNRSSDKVIYLKPKDAWGLNLYKKPLTERIIQISQKNYVKFYDEIAVEIEEILKRRKWLIVYDLHSYNHRRLGAEKYASPHENPEINIGTANVNKVWSPLIKELIHSIRSFNYQGRYLDVRENIKFQGGYFSKWLNNTFGDRVCPIVIEFKKFFMDEWTGGVDRSQLFALQSLLKSTIVPVIQMADKIKKDKN